MLQCVLQIGVIVLFRNYYYYAIIAIVINVLRNLIIAKNVDIMYPQYKAIGKLNGEILSDIRTKVSALFVYKVGNVVANSVDTLVISSFLGLKTLAIYNNYYYIISMLMGFMQIYYSSMSAGIGNSISVETKEKNYNDYSRLMFMQSWVVGWMSICLLCLYQPFIEVWVGTGLMLPFGMVIWLAVYFFYWKIQDIIYIYIEAAGLWQHDKYASLAGAIINLGLNIFLVNIIGIYGIVISTIVMNVLIIMPWRTRALYKFYFKKSSLYYYAIVLKCSIITVIGGVVTYVAGSIVKGDKIIVLTVRAVVCVIVPNIVFWICYRKNELFGETKDFLIGKVKNVL
jgi:O-antigen/teichoic acid export membrane protein